MKITKSQLKQIIKEELAEVVNQGGPFSPEEVQKISGMSDYLGNMLDMLDQNPSDPMTPLRPSLAAAVEALQNLNIQINRLR
tara:strand:+ start:24100 stop:24345 length:246 start_codon:yes stop_codon:yes gene_type:complete